MNESKATRYQRLKRRADAAAAALAGLALAVMAFTPAGRWLAAASAAVAASVSVWASRPLALLLFVTVVVACCELATLPAFWHRAARIDTAYGRPPSGTWRSWLAGAAIGLAAAWLSAVVVWLAAAFAGRGWWLVAGVSLSAVIALAARAGPLLVGGLGAVRPLERPTLDDRIARLSRSAGVPVAAIQELAVDDEAGTIAMVTGIGAGRRVLIARDVARNWSDDEVAVVVAHEISHHVHHDLPRALGLNALVLCLGLGAADWVVSWAGGWLGIAGVTDPAALPAIAFVTWGVWLAATPLRHAQSRRQELRADRFALEVTGHAEAFASAIRRASARRLVEDRPGRLVRWLYARHPTVSERLELAAGHQRATQSPPRSER